jgi:hypothetical protein
MLSRSLLLTIGLSACTLPSQSSRPKITTLVPGDPTAPSQVTPQESIAIAQTYVTHAWRPFARNILHGSDPNGVTVHTPDIGHRTPPDRPGWWLPGEVNQGIPYKWGGFDDPTSFDLRISSGHSGGDVSSEAKRTADNAAVSSHAAGVDCSGFVSRCLKLPAVHDTSQLPSVCLPIANTRDLQPGDILNIPRGHVVLFAGWARPDHSWIYYYDTGGGPDYWRPSLKESPLTPMLALGYQPLRYKGMAFDRTISAKAPLTRAVKSRALSVPAPTIGEP